VKLSDHVESAAKSLFAALSRMMSPRCGWLWEAE